MCEQCEIILHHLYDAKRQQADRNYATDHSYEEFRDYFLGDQGYSLVEGVKVPWEPEAQTVANKRLTYAELTA